MGSVVLSSCHRMSPVGSEASSFWDFRGSEESKVMHLQSHTTLHLRRGQENLGSAVFEYRA